MAAEAWSRLADLVRRQREERHLSQRQLGEAAGTTDRLISDIERVARFNYEPSTLRSVSRALGWTPDSIDEILQGGDPTRDDEDEPFDMARELAEVRRLLERIEAAQRGDDYG